MNSWYPPARRGSQTHALHRKPVVPEVQVPLLGGEMGGCRFGPKLQRWVRTRAERGADLSRSGLEIALFEECFGSLGCNNPF